MNKKEKTMIVDKELETTTDEFIIDFYYLYILDNETDDINVAVDSVYNELTKYNIKTTKEQVKKIIELYEKNDEFEDDEDSIS
ncbi:hypothetical protein [Capnocytophaga gingivalis]|jgi:hypothetical protein|uniref:hypothetical protein n=1 Tax=Capnocytophaga gingivalis TaxID=1017 RepID=UPI0028D43F71|nr:hypothetical protein [Capnocytophaga gingivalis]